MFLYKLPDIAEVNQDLEASVTFIFSELGIPVEARNVDAIFRIGRPLDATPILFKLVLSMANASICIKIQELHNRGLNIINDRTSAEREAWRANTLLLS